MTNAEFIRMRSQQWNMCSTDPKTYKRAKPFKVPLELFANRRSYGHICFYQVGYVCGGSVSLGTDQDDNVYACFVGGYTINPYTRKAECLEYVSKLSINLETEAVELGTLL